MNASDDRSVESFKQNIESVTQIRGTVNDQGFKPNCLIIDEIDGAPQVLIFIIFFQFIYNCFISVFFYRIQCKY